MASDADTSRQDTTLGLTPAGRIFKYFWRWRAVPVSDLLWLRHVLGGDIEAARATAVQQLLHVVDSELIRRSASHGRIIPSAPHLGGEEPCPEAG